MTDVLKVVVHCGEPAELKWNSGDPFWVCATCRKMLRRGTSLEMEAIKGVKYMSPDNTACRAVLDLNIVCGRARWKHTVDASKADVSLDHEFLDATWDDED